jgi:hypothetical protein
VLQFVTELLIVYAIAVGPDTEGRTTLMWEGRGIDKDISKAGTDWSRAIIAWILVHDVIEPMAANVLEKLREGRNV